MRRPEFIARQSGRPSGLLGRLIGYIMSYETASANEAAITQLDPRATDRVLEIGFGHGRTIERLAAAVPGGFVAGLDVSDDMLQMATRRCRSLIAAGRVRLTLGDSAAISYPTGSFDKVLAVHTIYFWSQPLADLQEVRRVLRPGATFVIGFRPKGDPGTAEFPASVYTFYTPDEVISLLRHAGFGEVTATAGSDGIVFARGVASDDLLSSIQ